MRIGSVGGYGFDPYRDYTTALQKSIRFAGPQPESAQPDPMQSNSGQAENTQADRPPVAEVQESAQVTAAAVEVHRPNPAIMEALRSVRQMTEDVTNAAMNVSAAEDASPRRDIRSMIPEMEDFQLSGTSSPASKMASPAGDTSLKRDSILQEYQYFVSPTEEANHLEQDGIFFAKTY